MKIAFLLDNAYGIGGTIRSTVNLSRALAARHTVEVVSVRQHVSSTALPFDPRVTLTPLIDLRRDSPAYDGDDPRFHRPSARFTEGSDHFERGIATHLGDVRLRDFLRGTDADVVIATRPKLVDALAAHGSDRYLRIGQEHLTHEMHSPHIRAQQDAAITRLDAFVTVSYADAAGYRATVPGSRSQPGRSGVTVLCIPNAVPAPDVEPSDGDSKLIVAAGRLLKIKRYDRLLHAFALVAEKHPDWRLRLYGRGRRQDQLRALIDSLGLSDRAFLMGPHSPIEAEWAKGAIAAVSSSAESFGMTLVEAMHCGVPVVSTDCPYGPGEIITNGRDGLLSPLADDERVTVRSYADALLQLIEDPALRHRMGREALQRAQRYAPDRIAAEYERLIEQLSANLSPRRRDAAELPPPVVPLPVRPAGRPPLRRRVRRTVAPVARPVARMLRGQRPVPGSGLRRQRARVRAEADGSLTVRLDASQLPYGERSLLLRARHMPDAEPVRVPLPASAGDGGRWVTVRVERGTHALLPEARWDTYVERAADGRRRRVHAELVETARLLSAPVPLDGDGALVPWVPYTTRDGYLAVHAWHRQGHAEVDRITLDRRGFRIRAMLYGSAAAPPAAAEGTDAAVEGTDGAGTAGDGAECSLVAVARSEDEHSFELPVRVREKHDGDRAPVVEAELPYDLPAALDSGAGNVTWDLWLRPGGEAPAVRLGRILGDLADRRGTDVTPPVALGGTAARLRFTATNDLTLSMRPAPAHAAGAERTAAPGEAPARTA